jgi:hypothetical protein
MKFTSLIIKKIAFLAYTNDKLRIKSSNFTCDKENKLKKEEFLIGTKII